MTQHYDRPNTAARAVNAVFRRLAQAGISVAGTRALWVRGRKSGALHSVVVNVMDVDGVDYLVSPRGNTQWARNARAAGVIELGPRWRRTPATLTEVPDEAKPTLLKCYLDRWYWEVKGHIGGLAPTSTTEQLRAAAPSIPVFALAR